MITLLSLLAAALGVLILWQERRLECLRAAARPTQETAVRLEKETSRASDESRRVLTLLEGMSEGVVVIDQDRRILLVNPALVRQVGIRADGSKGRYFWEVFRDAELNEMIEKAVRERKPAEKEHPVFLTKRTFLIRISPVFDGKIFLGAVAVFHDLTEIKQMQKAQREFVANVSHELKTPLTSIMGFIETLKEGVEDPKERGRFLGILSDQAGKLHTLIDDLLSLSRLDSDRESLKKQPVDLAGLGAKLFRSFDPALGAKRLEARTELPEKPFHVTAEPRLLEQALTNLIDNAIKYNKDGGWVTLSASRADGAARIRVEDTGIGIPKEDLDRIFERFYRVDKSRSRELGGTGLGLAIARDVAERHGGRLEAESRLGQGSAFTLTLPA